MSKGKDINLKPPEQLTSEQKDSATLFYSPKGQYLVGKFLQYGIEYHKTLDKPQQNLLHAKDIEFLIKVLFPFYNKVESEGSRKKKEFEDKMESEYQELQKRMMPK